MNIAIFCSGNGSNFQAIIDACKKGLFKDKIALMLCDNPNAYAVARAEKESIKTFIIERKNFSSKEKFEKRIIEELDKENIDLICLAGYMRMLSPAFVAKYRDRILNIHPALLPSFKGAHGIKDAMDNGARVTGVTVHFVNEEMDSGPIILQETVKIKDDDTEETLADRIHKVEHRLYPEAIKLFTEGKLKITGKKVKILAAVVIFFLIFGIKSEAMIGSDIVGALPLKQEIPKIDTPLEQARYITFAKVTLLEKSAEAVIKRHDERLGLLSFNLYDTEKGPCENSDNTIRLLNPKIDIEKPLTKKEIERLKIDNSIKAARIFAEVLDSLEMEFAREGTETIIDIATKIVGFREYMSDKYGLHFKADSDEALLRYKRNF